MILYGSIALSLFSRKIDVHVQIRIDITVTDLRKTIRNNKIFDTRVHDVPMYRKHDVITLSSQSAPISWRQRVIGRRRKRAQDIATDKQTRWRRVQNFPDHRLDPLCRKVYRIREPRNSPNGKIPGTTSECREKLALRRISLALLKKKPGNLSYVERVTSTSEYKRWFGKLCISRIRRTFHTWKIWKNRSGALSGCIFITVHPSSTMGSYSIRLEPNRFLRLFPNVPLRRPY